jgi:predicted ArsR family transcriptional regulator
MPAKTTEAGREKRQAMLAALQGHFDKEGYAPAFQELARELDMASSTARFHLENLRKQGFVTYADGAVSRSMKLSRKGRADTALSEVA